MRWVLITAILVGTVSSFYHLWLQTPLTLNSLSPSFSIDETFFYTPKVISPLKNPGEIIPAALMRLLAKLSGSTVNGFILADFIFPAITFLALFFLTKSITVSVCVLIFYHYLTYFPYLPSVIKLFISYWQNGSYWPLIRGFHPQISLGLFFLFAARPGILTLTLLTYTDFFYWTAALAWLVFFRFGRPLIKIIACWLILALPYWYYIAGLWPAADYWQRNYFYQPPSINQILLLIFGFCLSWGKKYWMTFYLGIMSLITCAILFKFGADDPIGHWFLRVVNPMTAVLIFTIFFNKFKLSKTSLTILIIGLLIFQFRLHWKYFKNNAPTFAIDSEKLEAFKYLKQNTPVNSIVATASLADSLYLPAYTYNQPYLKQAQLSPAGNQELVDRFLEVFKSAGFNNNQLTFMFTNNQVLKDKKRFDLDACAGHFLFFRLYAGADYYNCAIPKNILDQLLNEYAQTTPTLTYPADYWLGRNEIDFGRLLWENQDYKIYALH